jgi:hypothetical protein
MPYVLEVLRMPIQPAVSPTGVFEHVGYLQAVFRRKKDACSYYDEHNPHMRPLNARNTYKSDWDPNSRLLYIVRTFHGEKMTIEPWRQTNHDSSCAENTGV